MNGKKAKRLRRMAEIEMAADEGVVNRELVVTRLGGGDRVINNPNSVRAFNLALKDRYRKINRVA